MCTINNVHSLMHRNVTVIHTPIHSIKASWRIEIFCKSVKGYIPGWYFQNNVETSAAALQKLVSHRKTMQNIWIADGRPQDWQNWLKLWRHQGKFCNAREENAMQGKQCKPVKLSCRAVNIAIACALRPYTSLYDRLGRLGSTIIEIEASSI